MYVPSMSLQLRRSTKQIKQIDKIVKSYDKSGMVIGEAPLMKDLQDVTDIDLTRVNVISIAAIFIINFAYI